MGYMFRSASAFNQDISAWDTSQVSMNNDDVDNNKDDIYREVEVVVVEVVVQ